jgi:large subunit ribosomal protein L6
MSRVGKKPIEIPGGATVTVKDAQVTVKGGQGELNWTLPPGIHAEVAGSEVVVTRENETRRQRSCHGLSRSLIANMIEGVTKGFSKKLEIQGVGFKANIQGQKLEMALGFASPVHYEVPPGVKCEVEGGTVVTVSGPDKQQVGLAAARIRSFYPAEPYKGKGVRYRGERVRRKVGKTVA